MYDVVALGELLIDFMEQETKNTEKLGVEDAGKREPGKPGMFRSPVYEANPGGAPCNVLAMLRKFGYQTAFIGKVGNDSFGKMLHKTLLQVGIDGSGLRYDPQIPTTLAFVHHKPDGDREFSFYRSPGADLMLQEDEIPYEMIRNCKIFHFGSLSMTSDPARSATKAAVRCAKEAGSLISFDPNLRSALWTDLEDAAAQIWYGIAQCDILKIADNELEWLTGSSDPDEGIRIIRERVNVPMINVTLGNHGSISYYGEQKVYAEPFLTPHTIDTTGAGDTFCACILGDLLENGLEHLSEMQLRKMLIRANAAASIITTRKGAICSMPETEEICKLTSQTPYGKLN